MGGKGANPPVDASGALPDGRAFSGPDEFRQLLVQDLDRFAEFERRLGWQELDHDAAAHSMIRYIACDQRSGVALGPHLPTHVSIISGV